MAAVADRYFWDIRLKILRLPNFIMLFQLVLTTFSKGELFSCFPESWSRDKGMYEMYENKRPNSIYLFIIFFYKNRNQNEKINLIYFCPGLNAVSIF